jgi:hypothetical protein
MMNIMLIVLTYIMTMNPNVPNQTALVGDWKIEEQNELGEWILKINNDTTEFRNWGTFFKFNNDGTYSQHASAPCGLDDNRFSYVGKWKYNGKSKMIYLTEIKAIHQRPNVYQNYTVLSSGSLKVISVQDNMLKLKVVNNWEKVSKKK